MRTIRVVLFMDANAWSANENMWWATSKPCAPTPWMSRYQIVVEIPDPRAADEVVRGEVTDITEPQP